MRYRTAEAEAIKAVHFSTKIMPIVEIVTKVRPRSKKLLFEEAYLDELSFLILPFMIDIPIYINTNKSTKETVRDFIDKFKNNPSLKVDYYQRLSQNKNIIPVLSYSQRNKSIPNDFISDACRLIPFFKRIAFRFFKTKDFSTIINDIQSIITKDDILIFDIGKTLYNGPKLLTNIQLINNTTQMSNCTSVIIRSTINEDVVFNKMSHGNVVPEADNGLLQNYTSLGFNAFGDFAGIRKDPTIHGSGGGKPSAGFLFYSCHTNSYIGFKGNIPRYTEFTNTIKPSLLNFAYWNLYPDKHHLSCPGCKNIFSNSSSAPVHWKSYAIEHYITTLEQYL